MTAGLNDSPKFIEALARLVIGALGGIGNQAISLQENVPAPLMAAD